MKAIDIQHSILTSAHELRNENRRKIMQLYHFTFLKNFDTILANNPFSNVFFMILISSQTFRVKVIKYMNAQKSMT